MYVLYLQDLVISDCIAIIFRVRWLKPEISPDKPVIVKENYTKQKCRR